MFPAGLEPATFRVWGGHDNHYQSALGQMCDAEKDWHERSFGASGEINGCQKFPLDEPEIKKFRCGLPKFEWSKTVSNAGMPRL